MDQQQTDTLYQSFDRSLYKITGQESLDNILDIMQADNTTSLLSGSATVSTNLLSSGVSIASVAQGSGTLSAGKQSFTDLTSGYMLGIDATTGLPMFSIGNSTSYITFDGSTLTVVGGFSVTEINIPDTTTTASFHVDSSGNTWWGANVASGLSAANASITDAGVATFKSVSIGGAAVQYVITNSGIFSYGDGSDSTATLDGSTLYNGFSSLVGSTYSLTRDVYFTTLTINNGVTLNPNGYRIFCSIELINNGTIDRSGSPGGNGGSGGSNNGTLPITGGTAGTAGNSLADGYLKGSVAGQIGGVGQGASGPGTGNAGTATSNSIGSSGSAGGNGGAASSPAAGGTGGTATPSNVKLIANWHLATLLDISSTGSTIKFNNSAGAGSGAGGNSGGNSSLGTAGGGGGGGGSGSSGGIIAIYAKIIATTGVISANGGNGGTGGSAGAGTAPSYGGYGGGGGASGNGGILVLVYNTLTNSGSFATNAGTPGGAGNGGNLGGSSGPGQPGISGSNGTIFQFELSL